jgi:rhamnosyl/mannosyltransferase
VARRGSPPDTPLVGETIHATPWLELGGTPVCPTMPWHALRRQRAAPFDIVHLQFPADPMAHVAAELLPRSVARVITWHSDIIRQRGLFSLYRPLLDRLLRSADAVIAPTPFQISASQQLGAVRERTRLHVVPFGFDLRRFAEPSPLAEAIRRRFVGRFLVFAVGRHVYYKGFEFLLRALAELPEASLVLGGTGPLSGQLRDVARNAGVAGRVEFTGRIAEADLPAYYQACDVYCLPSVERAEAFGIVQLEAMAAGKPVVCCELGNGVNWVNRDGVTGLAVAPADPHALAQALRRLKDDVDLRTRLGAQGRERALREFTLEAMARSTLQVYRDAVQSRL